MVYFLGGQSPDGFRTDFDKLISEKGYYTYILKGGAGTGKSTLIHSIAERFSDRENADLYRCASDLNSLDAVVFNRSKAIVVDGTAPHTFDPEYPAVCQEIINLGELWDGEAIAANGEKIIALSEENKRLHLRSRRYIGACAALCTDTVQIASAAVNSEKLDGFALRLAAKITGKSKRIREGRLHLRQLSAMTSDGYVTCPPPDDYTVYLLNDPHQAGATALLGRLAAHILHGGHDVIASECHILCSPLYEHILIPELKTAVMTSSSFNGFTSENKLPINMKRFYINQELAAKKQRIGFNRRGAKELSEEAAFSIGAALKVHDELERFYSSAMNFAALKPIEERISAAVERRMQCKCNLD